MYLYGNGYSIWISVTLLLIGGKRRRESIRYIMIIDETMITINDERYST
jgi:hypothetical protein